MKLISLSRLLTCLGWITALGFIEYTTAGLANSATRLPFDEPPCYMRTQDGRIVNLQSLCSRSTPTPTQPGTTNQQPQRTLSPQASPSQVSVPHASATSGGHDQGNPDSDDGRY